MPSVIDFLVPIVIVLLVVSLFFLTLRSITRLYVKVPPNRAAVFYGRRSRGAKGALLGARILSGGGKIRVPILEEVAWLDLGSVPIDLDVKDIPNINGVPVSVKGVATIKIRSDESGLAAAAERFLFKPQTEVKQIVFENLLGHLRAIIGRMQIEELIRERQRFNEEVLKEAGEDLARMGIQVDALKIQDIKDPLGYIDALAKPRTTEIQRDAQIAAAVNKSEGDQKSAVANQQGRMAEATAEAEIARARRDRDVKIATYTGEVGAEQARAQQAGPLANAKAQQEVVQAETVLAERAAERREAQLKAEVVKPAEATREQIVVQADAARQRVILEAEAVKQQRQLEGEGEAAKIRMVGEAEGQAIRARLLGEAEGIKAKAEAMKLLDESGRTLLILDRLPDIIRSAEPVMKALAEPLSNIKEMKILDIGGSGQGAARFAANSVALLAALAEQLKVTGVFDTLIKAVKEGKGDEKAEPKTE